MSTYREKIEDVRDAIESILNQTIKKFEFLIVLDDPNNEEMKRCIEEYQAKDERIIFSVNDCNLGLAKSLNKSLQRVKGKYIARMDADDISYANRFEEQLKYIESGQFDLIGALKEDIDENGDVLKGTETVYETPEHLKKLIKISNEIPHPTWFVKKEVYEEMQGYRNLPRSQDYDFLLRALAKNKKIGLCPKILLKYRRNPIGISQSGKLKQFLTAKYLMKNNKCIERIKVEQAIAYVEKKATLKATINFEQADKLFLKAHSLKKTDVIRASFLILKAMSYSRYFCYKVFLLIKRKIVRMLFKVREAK